MGSQDGSLPIVTGMMPDSSKYYVANFLDNSISVITVTGGDSNPIATVTGKIDLLQNYNHPDHLSCAITPSDQNCTTITGFIGGLPIQTPVSPNGKYEIIANTLTANIIVVNTSTDKMVAQLPCDAGCHGVQFGAKKGVGYYAYVSSKFSNRMIVVDPDPNSTGPHDGSAAVIAGSFLLTTDNKSSKYASDDTVAGNAGMGGQGVLPIPLVYNGWVQNLPSVWKNQLTTGQQNPFP